MKKIILGLLITAVALPQCVQDKNMTNQADKEHKVVIYQVLPRLFGNTETLNRPWGTIEENGVGKFNDFTDEALTAIRELGVTHIWYTGVLHHCLVGDYSAHGIDQDDPDVVKGRAGSPYAVRDYFNVNPDLAVDPEKRLEEFRTLVERTHRNGLNVIIDIVPNHVARNYHSLTNPQGMEDFGASDDTSVEYARDNNFYYIPGEPFQVPDFESGFEPLGGEAHPLLDGEFDEMPAKWTGNGARAAKPNVHDWYETVKVNFGVRPDGQKDFPVLPEDFAGRDYKEHFAFWQGKDVPDSWVKFRDIALYWLDMGVDGFRYDMAQMVPVEFWSYLNSSIKMERPDAFLLSEIYIPEIYRDYIRLGKMDYLYDKVELYDTLKNIIRGNGSTDHLPALLDGLSDIEHHMLHFLENHDEQRIASNAFAGDPWKALPAMVVSATVSTSPTMIYFGQEVGEPATEDAGFGKASRTTIFDYWGVPAHQRWMNGGKFDGGGLTEQERALRVYYKTLLNFTIRSEALTGAYAEVHTHNRKRTESYSGNLFSFLRWSGDERLLVVTNFEADEAFEFTLEIPSGLIGKMELRPGKYHLKDQLDSGKEYTLEVDEHGGYVEMRIEPLESVVLSF